MNPANKTRCNDSGTMPASLINIASIFKCFAVKNIEANAFTRHSKDGIFSHTLG